MAKERIKSGFLKVAGYFIPLVQSIPFWTGLMTLPFATYLITIFTNLQFNLSKALFELFMPFQILEKTCIITGFLILVYSIFHLITNRKEGLITTGPYQLLRHPQYFGMILSTLGLTSWSVWILNNTFGIGFLSPLQTIGVWFIELFAYILLAYIEERHLSRKYKEYFENYKSHVPFFIPFIKTNKGYMDTIISILIPSFLLFGLLRIGKISPIL